MQINLIGVDGNSQNINYEQLKGKDVLIDRRKKLNVLLIILAGYKSFVYDNFFDRVKKFTPPPTVLDICVVSSGLFDEQLADIAKENDWSYLSTSRNCVSLAQNIAISLHPNATFIYKLDEDIFVTKHCFETMMTTYQRVHESNYYDIGFVAPLIPLNGYGSVRILEKLGMVGMYEKLFEKVKFGPVLSHMLATAPNVAKFFWGEGGYIPSIDYLDNEFYNQEFCYSACPVRFNIGFILFHRSVWENLGGFYVPETGSAMGKDEDQLCNYCIIYSQAIIIAENTVVGHLSFNPQNQAMKDYYETHPDVFRCP